MFRYRLVAFATSLLLAFGMAAAPAAFATPPSTGTSYVPLPCAGGSRPLVIAHRGASGYAPEHTLASYALAIEMGADYIEPDLVSSKDGVLVARHENDISGTTDVADHPEFASRRKTKTVDGNSITGWFTEDFTLAELKTLRAKERLPQYRPGNTRLDGIFRIPTFQEVLDLARASNFRFQLEAKANHQSERRCLGVYPETKHPTYFRGIGLPLERKLVHQLEASDFYRETRKAFIQSFEVGNLQYLKTFSQFPLIQLMDASGAPWDFVAAGDPRTYADMATPDGLVAIAQYAQGIGVNKNLIIPRDSGNSLGTPTTLVADAHAAGLLVHSWTFRAENVFLPTDFQSAGGPADRGDLAGEITTFLDLGMDGFFTDQSDIGVATRDAFAASR